MTTSKPTRIDVLEAQLLQAHIQLAGIKLNLHDGAAADIAQRVKGVYTFNDDGSIRSHAGESIEDCLKRLKSSDGTRHFFATDAPSDTSGTLSPTELAKMSPEARLRYANEQQALKKRH